MLSSITQQNKKSQLIELLISLPLAHSQGGVDDEVILSAYITIALLEMPLPVTVGTTSFPVKWGSGCKKTLAYCLRLELPKHQVSASLLCSANVSQAHLLFLSHELQKES